MLEDLHAGEQRVEVRFDDLVDQDELVRLDLDEARQDRRDLHPGEPVSPVSGSRRPTAIDRLSVEMYGNGWPGSTARGVRTG